MFVFGISQYLMRPLSETTFQFQWLGASGRCLAFFMPCEASNRPLPGEGDFYEG